MFIRHFNLWLFLGCLIAGEIDPPLTVDRRDETTDLSGFFGFKELEIFKLERRNSNMLSGDLNADGFSDVLLIDNSHSRLDLLQQRGERPQASTAAPRSVNLIENDWRFLHRKISVDKQVDSMTLGDFDDDGRTDIAYFATPEHLIVRYQSVSGDWTQKTSVRLPDVQPTLWITASGDLNHDGKKDIVVLGKDVTYVLHQLSDGKLDAPKPVMNTSDKLGLLQIADLDGDGRDDLCYQAKDGNDHSFCARLQRSDGQLGPELRFEMNQSRSITLANIDSTPQSEILSVEAKSGRVKIHRLERPQPKAGELAGRLIQYGFGQQGSGRDRDLAIGDLNGDGLVEVVVSDPDAARMIVFEQRQGMGLDLGRPFPGFVGTKHIRMNDLGGDQAPQIVVLSSKEKTIGLSRMQGGRLTFPEALHVRHEPIALEVADLSGDGRKEILYISRERIGRESKYALQALTLTEKREWQPYLFEKAEALPLALRGAPERLVVLDANNDNRPDFLIFLGLDRAPHLLVTNEQGVPTPVASEGGIQLGDVSAGSVFIGSLDQPVILAAQDRFARNLQLDSNGKWKVVDQYNASETDARIAGVATVNLDGQPGNEIVLVDLGVKKLRVLRREENVFRQWREVDIGSFPYKSTWVSDLNGDGKHDLLLFGSKQFAVLYAGQSDPTLQEIASFETKVKDVYFSDLSAGDLNADGHIDLVAIDTRSHGVEILDFVPASESSAAVLRHSLYFKIFEEKSFRNSEAGGTEPREAVIADVTKDGRADLLLLTHDRVLLYPQDDGK